MNRVGTRADGLARLWRLAPVLLPVALTALFFHRLTFTNLILARGDTFLYFYPYWQAAADALRAGRIPLWNPDIFMGAPFLANSQAGFFYPLNWPVWLLWRTPYAVSAAILLHVTIAGWGTYLAARRALGLERTAALFAAALFALGGYLTSQVEHVNQLQGLAWLPWYFAALGSWAREAGREAGEPGRAQELLLPILAVGALLALQLLAGHTQTAFISGVSVAIWLVANLSGLGRPDRSRVARAAVVLAAGAALAAALAAVQLLPTLELTRLSSRQGGLPLDEVLSFSWHPLHLTRALLPAYGQELFSEYVAFLPLTALALAVAGAWPWRRERAVWPWLLLLIVALVLAFGRFTPVYYLLGRLPGFDLFRVPARWLAVAALAVALLAGYGWQRVRRFATGETCQVSEDLTGLKRPLLVAGIGLALLIGWGFAAAPLALVIPTGAEAPFAFPAGRTLLGWLIEFVLLGLLLWVALSAPRGRATRAPFDLLALALAVLWLGSRGLPYDRLTTPEAFFDLRPPVARLLARAACDAPCAAPPDRFLSLSDIFFDPGDGAEIDAIYADQLDAAALYDYLIAIKHKEVLSPNLSMVYGLPAVDGFDGGVLPLREYGRLMGLILPEGTATTDGRLREYLPAAPDARWLSLFNGRYLITDKVGDEWREGVFFDRQHPFRAGEGSATVADVPPFEATELWLLSEGTPPPIEIAVGGQTRRLAPALLAAPDLYRATFPELATVEAIRLLPCDGGATGCGASALTLVDSRDGAFQPLAPAPYRLIHSGDVKIYENLDAQPRAFLVAEWQWQPDAAAVEAMRAAEFDPRLSAVLVGDEVDGPAAPGAAANGGAVEIVGYTPEHVTLRVTGDGGLVVLTDAFYPGWVATLDGAPVVIYQADGLFRGVFAPAGEHEIEFHFRPRGVRVGAALSLGGLAVAAVGVALLAVRRRSPS
ncbi:hypothetical protein [Promineifilum sp.]|uniref:hypothetical protein n=1 Tax=Promineifilum sp. TaxID=2664178 RepID=UPI0035B23A6A